MKTVFYIFFALSNNFYISYAHSLESHSRLLYLTSETSGIEDDYDNLDKLLEDIFQQNIHFYHLERI
jgi:hypothetical protein